ncbi:unnamed protein product [Phytomonas sp. Hart1]|nr:unnamed protein product [Phytomonas sp. Hart1]|eukprot:CCW66953.1 unnamed protein product [Phytomonas sp. isolate Hart1]
MTEQSYNPFSGYGRPGRHSSAVGMANGGGGLDGKVMPPVDWAKKSLVAAKWKVVDVDAIKRAAAAKSKTNGSGGGSYGKNGGDGALTEQEAQAWREAHGITIFADNGSCPAPLTEFSMLAGENVPSYLHTKLSSQGFKAPTPVQAQCWPVLLSGRDLVGVAKTGSGKTLAFIVPALAHIALQEPLRPGDGPMCVVLAPTRELAQQIEQETAKVLPQHLSCGCIYGGSPKGPQLGMLRRGLHILVATPGRLIDFIQIKRVNMLRVTYLVLDEADRMLDMGFEPQVRAICSQIRPDRQTLMFSATWPKEIQRLASSFQRDWIRIQIGSTELLANKDVTQNFILTQESGKFEELKKLMGVHRNTRVLVFCKTKKTADYLEYQLKRIGIDAMAIHGDKEQRQREFILERFRRDHRLCLVATDVAARGLDIKELEVVVNYDFPMQIDDYVHRIGRTGRAGAKGTSYTMLTKHEQQIGPDTIRELVKILERTQQTVEPWLQEWADAQNYRHGAPKRNRNMMGNFGNGRRDSPRLRMPGEAPSFNPRGGAGGRGRGNHFGLGARDGAQAFKGTENPYYKKFEESDDDERPALPTKLARQ